MKKYTINAASIDDILRATQTNTTFELPLFQQKFKLNIENKHKYNDVECKLKPMGKIIFHNLYILMDLQNLLKTKKEQKFFLIDDEIYLISIINS